MGRRLPGVLAVLLLATGVVAVGPMAVSGASTAGPVNLGFEDGLVGWNAGPVTDGATVVDVEDGSDSPTYAATGTVIEPNNGDRMLRLGTPKEIAETQSVGPTTVSQTFAPGEEALVVAARVLSWEFRDGDLVTISGKGLALAEPVTFFTGASARTCVPQGPQRVRGKLVYPEVLCQFTMSGTKGVLLDSGWQQLRLVPSGEPVTETRLAYTVEGTQNSSHATWAYVDDVNRPPVAQFTSEPPTGALVYEGSLVQLRDTSYDPDLPDDIVAWSWTVTAPPGVLLDDDGVLMSTAADPSFFPPQDGDYAVAVTATSSDGRSDTATRTIRVTNAPTLVNALDVEVLAGGQAPIQGRYLDPGWTDGHTATIDGVGVPVPDPTSAGPALRRGVVSGTVAAPGAAGTSRLVPVSVDDADGDGGDGEPAAGSTDRARVTVIPSSRTRDEATDDSVAAPPAVVADVSRLSWIQETGDVDVVELKLAGGDLLPGTEVVAALDEVPADLDLVVLARTPGTTSTAPYQMAPYQMAPYQMAPYQMAPYQMAPYQMAPITQAPYQMAPYQMAPYQMADLGLSPYQMAPYQMAPYQMAPLSTDISITSTLATGGGDVDPAELGISGLLDADPTLQVAGFSANRGLETESVLVRVDQPDTELFVVVLGANGAYSDTPYRLRLESSAPWNAVADADTSIRTTLDAAWCTGTRVADQDVAPPPVDLSGAPSTLIVTQLDRLRAAHPDDDWGGFSAALEAYAEHPAVQGQVLDLPRTIYDAWDDDPCRVDAANAVTDSIRAAIQQALAAGDHDYVVILGDDAVVPFRRTTTGVVIGDESQYLAGSFLAPGSPLAAALAASQELTDDFYTDEVPTPFQTGDLYVPDVVTARMVETPDEIAGQMTAFVAPGVDGRLDATTALVTAHDFLGDGGQAIASSLGPRTDLVADLTETWSADSLRCRWLGDVDACVDPQEPAAPGIVSPNSHWTHYASLSALGWSTATDDDPAGPGYADILTSAEVAATPSPVPHLVFTIGCHAGFSVPDEQSLDGTAYGIDPSLDFAQAMARRQAVYVASTGFGLGDTEGLAGTEQLMADFADELLVTGVSAGQALLAAKQAYVAALSTVSTYDAKSLMQQTLYGPPQYQVLSDSEPVAAAATIDAAAPAGTTITPNGDGSDQYAFTLSEQALDGDRRYWTVAGDVQVTPGRPWQPRAVITDGVDDTVHGALVTAGSYTDVPNVQPVVTRPTMEWEDGPGTLTTCRDSWWPADLTTVGDGAVVVVPGQFRCTSGTMGTQRLYGSLDLHLLRSPTGERTPPTAGPLDIRAIGTDLELRFPASDASGIARLVPLVLHAGTITSTEVTSPAAVAGTYRVVLDDVPAGAEIVVQVVDGAGNVTTLTGRGANLRHLPVVAPSPVLYEADGSATFRASVPPLATLDGPVEYLWQFGDGRTASGRVESGAPGVSIDPATGDATFTVTHVYAGDLFAERVATVRVWDANGRTGTTDVVVARRCDPTGDVSSPDLAWGDIERCGVALAGGTVTFTLGYAAAISPDGAYRIEVDSKPGAKRSTLTQLKYDAGRGTWTGPSSLQVSVDPGGRTLRFAVRAKDLGVTTSFAWRSDVQSGIAGSPGDGIIDRLPDSGWLSWTAP